VLVKDLRHTPWKGILSKLSLGFQVADMQISSGHSLLEQVPAPYFVQEMARSAAEEYSNVRRSNSVSNIGIWPLPLASITQISHSPFIISLNLVVDRHIVHLPRRGEHMQAGRARRSSASHRLDYS
jgi:hypothetical protein